MTRLVINTDSCKGCGLCVAACPKKLLSINTARINAGGYHPVEIASQQQCVSCASCARICPDMVFTVHR